MDAHEKEKIKIKLIEEINSTSEKINKYKELSKPIAPENSIGRISRMDAINNKTIVDRMLRNSEEKLKKLKFNLTLIETKDFGNCRKCKKEININRIKLMPEVSTCVKCS